MKMVLAQLKKDFRCQRDIIILLLICLGLIAFPVVGTLLFKHTSERSFDFLHLTDTQRFAGVVSSLALFMLLLPIAMLGFCLSLPLAVIRVVQDDSLVETTAFWRTRPLPRSKLLSAKLLFIGLLILPFVLTGTEGKAGADTLWPAMAAFIAALAALASITPRMSTCLGYGVACWFGKGIFSAIINRLWDHWHGPGGLLSDEAIRPLTAIGEFFHFNAGDFFNLCYIAGFGAVFVHQYLTLRTKRSLALFITALVAIGILQMLAGPKFDDSEPAIRINSSASPTP